MVKRQSYLHRYARSSATLLWSRVIIVGLGGCGLGTAALCLGSRLLRLRFLGRRILFGNGCSSLLSSSALGRCLFVGKWCIHGLGLGLILRSSRVLSRTPLHGRLFLRSRRCLILGFLFGSNGLFGSATFGRRLFLRGLLIELILRLVLGSSGLFGGTTLGRCFLFGLLWRGLGLSLGFVLGSGRCLLITLCRFLSQGLIVLLIISCRLFVASLSGGLFSFSRAVLPILWTLSTPLVHIRKKKNCVPRRLDRHSWPFWERGHECPSG
ncbi:hypothetical protein B0T26DRAFT_506044 [Lasiosphaeria miniovina]|uniref:Uncharacterized protein n=1 Tax=Lasiosphaeria miniovina TaxID=1954250 RepID=A0AA39ZTS0_9PEZI|nr:uncharacterized protein B0T26DRAFT_506044 [Lasiosphaeria miniovina]KAK0703576.1 hypothetical protein B0T26DRAFT_506044 [Lasiosphaeria miniovina]